ncbi:histidine kinase [Bacteroidia bacterium]|nr:histidine kinase [Bacteroidia bacterium]
MEKSILIKNELRELTRLNDFIGQAIEELRLAPSTGMNVKLAVEEAVVNCISYAYPGETGKEIFIQLDCEPEKLTVVITDYGIAFDPTAKQDPDVSLPLDRRAVGGLGTYLTKQLMTRVSYCRGEGKNVLTLTKKLH